MRVTVERAREKVSLLFFHRHKVYGHQNFPDIMSFIIVNRFHYPYTIYEYISRGMRKRSREEKRREAKQWYLYANRNPFKKFWWRRFVSTFIKNRRKEKPEKRKKNLYNISQVIGKSKSKRSRPEHDQQSIIKVGINYYTQFVVNATNVYFQNSPKNLILQTTNPNSTPKLNPSNEEQRL